MNNDKKTLLIPILLITVGTGWLLTTLNIAPHIDWSWILGLLVVGLLEFVVDGFNKVTVVIGPFFIAASCLSVLRQTGQLKFNVEVPILVILTGFLLLIARMKSIPLPKWIIVDPESNQQ